MVFLRRLTANGRRPGWGLKLDVASFFASIHKATLYDLVAARVRDPELRWLTRTILFHDPTRDYRFRSLGGRTPGPEDDEYPVPAAKSLFGLTVGFPLGALRTFVARAIAAGRPVLLVRERRRREAPWLVERVPHRLWVPASAARRRHQEAAG